MDGDGFDQLTRMSTECKIFFEDFVGIKSRIVSGHFISIVLFSIIIFHYQFKSRILNNA